MDTYVCIYIHIYIYIQGEYSPLEVDRISSTQTWSHFSEEFLKTPYSLYSRMTIYGFG